MDSANPSPALLASTQKTLKMSSIPVHLLAGNHEQVSTAPGHHSLAPLAPVVEKIWDQPDFFEGVMVYPFSPKGGTIVLDPRRKDFAGVIGHFGISCADDPSWLRNSVTAVSVEVLQDVQDRYREFSRDVNEDVKWQPTPIFAGDWHRHKRHSLTYADAVQVGALVPTGWSDSSNLDSVFEDPYGSVIVWDTETGEWFRKVIPGPRFYTAVNLVEVESWVQKNTEDTFTGNAYRGYFRIRCDPTTYPSLSKKAKDLEEAYTYNGLPTGSCAALGGILVEIERPNSSVMGALAQEVSDTENVEDAVREYVNKAEFDSKPNKEAVIERALSLLRSAKAG